MLTQNNISGYQNELEISRYLNGKKIRQLNPNFFDLITEIYGNLDPELIIHTKIDYTKKKFDMIIDIDKNIKRISIKKGICNSVHVEGISSFIHFLIDSGVPKETVVAYLKYHYADGTTNGTGKERKSVEEYKIQNPNSIHLINQKINTIYILNRAINRFLLQGKNSNIKIDAIIYGTKDDFLWITSDDVKKIILSKMNMESTSVHFGPLFCQPLTRCLNRNPKLERKRFLVQIKWYSIFDDIIEYKNKKMIQEN